MDLMSQFTISASMLLTGFTIVFSVLVFLIFIIWLYGKIVTKAQSKPLKKKKIETKIIDDKKPVVKPADKPAEIPVSASENELPEEIVAVISAAVYSMYGSKEKVRIKSIKKIGARSAWSNAGILNNTRPF